jgi:hypothetical protein
MRRSRSISLSALALLLANAPSGNAAPYFPYETIENYYKTQPEPVPPPPTQKPPEPSIKDPRQAGPLAITQAPDFLFPPKLGFGVAVAVPYDMAYVSKDYYLWQGGVWYRSYSYRGPWTALGQSQLPPELRKHKLAKIRELRNLEFGAYWKDKDQYKGKRFHPGSETAQPQVEERQP